MQRLIFVASAFFSLFFFAKAGAVGVTDPASATSMRSIGKLSPSFYWIAIEPNDNAPRTKKLFDEHGNLLYAVSESYYKALAMEGTGKLLNGKVINYHVRITLPDGSREIRWRFCGPEAPFGYGVDDLPLIPFRSVAVDETVIPMGSRIYIPAAVGARLPDGTRHDGYFTAVDIGDRIKNRKIDIFTSFGDQSSVFAKVGLVTNRLVEVFLVE